MKTKFKQMKLYIYLLATATFLLCLPSCNKYTELTPKGRSLIETQADLERIANKQYFSNAFNFRNGSIIINEQYPQTTDVPALVNGINKNLNYAMVTWDESIDRGALTLTDATYSDLYGIVNGVANVLILKADEVTGDAQALKALKAEGQVIRAFMHFYLVNLYAKSYDPVKAASAGGVPYVEDLDFIKPNEKQTVKVVYEKIMADLNAATVSDALPNIPLNSQRVGKGLLYALKAKVLLYLRDYTGALENANAALAIHRAIEDQRPLIPAPNGPGVALSAFRNRLTAANNIFYAYSSSSWPFLTTPSAEILNEVYEPGAILSMQIGVNRANTYFYTTPNNNNMAGLPETSGAYAQNNGGFTTEDVMFIKAECLIRSNRVNEGLDLINQIRERRIFPYTALTATDDVEAMLILQKLYRIEFLFSGKSFFELKRWNTEGTYPVVMKKNLLGKEYILSPDSPLWVYPFPQSATMYNPSLTQNY